MARTPHRRMTRRRRPQAGGAYVHHGTYGCGFRPALRCEGEAARRPGKFAKLVPKDTSYDEMKLMRMLRSSDPDQRYFLYPETICTPAPYTAADQMARCPHDFSARDEARVIILTKGGKALSQFQPTRADYPAFFSSLVNLFEGLQRIHANGIAHNDIKPDNVVTRKRTDGTYMTKFIDFGFMAKGADLAQRATKESDTLHDYSILQSNYRYWSFDMRMTDPAVLASAAARSASTATRIQNYYRGLGPHPSFPHRAFDYPRLTIMSVSQIAQQLHAMPIVRRHNFIMSHSDILGLGLTLAQVYYRLTGHSDNGGVAPHVVIPDDIYNPAWDNAFVEPQYAHGVYNAAERAWNVQVRDQISIPLFRLIRRMIHVNPFDRISLADALAEYQAILPAINALFSPANILAHLKVATLQRADKDYPVDFAPLAAGAAASSSPAAAAAAAEDDVVFGFEQSPLLSASPEKIPREFAVSSTSSPSSSPSWRRRSLNTLSLSSNSSGTRRRRIREIVHRTMREHGLSPRRTRKNSSSHTA